MYPLNEIQKNLIDNYTHDALSDIFSFNGSIDDLAIVADCFEKKEFNETFHLVLRRFTEAKREKILKLKQLFEHACPQNSCDKYEACNKTFKLNTITTYQTLALNQTKKVVLENGSEFLLTYELAPNEINKVNDFFLSNALATDEEITVCALEPLGLLSLTDHGAASKKQVTDYVQLLIAHEFNNVKSLAPHMSSFFQGIARLDSRQTHAAIIEAIQSNNLGLISHLTDNEVRSSVLENNFVSILTAVKYDRLEVLYRLFLPLSDTEKKEAIKKSDYLLLCAAVSKGNLKIIKLFERFLTEKELSDVTRIDNCFVIRGAAAQENSEILQHFEARLSPKERVRAIEAGYFSAIQVAIRFGRLNNIKHLEQAFHTKEDKKIFDSARHRFFYWAAIEGQLDVIKHFEQQLSKEEIIAVIREDNYSLVATFAYKGDLNMLSHLFKQLTSEEVKEAIRQDDFASITLAGEADKLDVVIRLLLLLENKEERRAAVKAKEYRAIREAAAKGCLNVITYYETQLNFLEKKDASKTLGHNAIWLAAQKGHLDVVEHFEARLNASEKKAMFYSLKNNEFTGFFNRPCLPNLIASKLAVIRREKSAFEAENQRDTFCLKDDDKEYVQCLLNYLVSQASKEKGGCLRDIQSNIDFLSSLSSINERDGIHVVP